jgi:AcrR family transcriptional regulator
VARSAMIRRAEPDGDVAAPPALTRADWIARGLALLISEGVDAIRITRLANDLGVTRGSFYWHFRDRADLLEALIGRWQDKNTAAIVEALDREDDLTRGILALFDAWLDAGRFDPRLDAAVRDWARRTESVRLAVETADRQRVDTIARFLDRCGYSTTEAFVRARIIYFTQVGYFALGIDETLVQRIGYLEPYFEGFTGRPLAPAVAAAYRARHLRGRDS